MPSKASLFSRVGPGLITVCVVIGPGSILTSSKVGSQFGFELLWVLLVAIVLMLTYMALGARLGVMADANPGELIRRRWGGWLTFLLGASVFTIAATFQFGNNLGVMAALESWTSSPESAAPGEAAAQGSGLMTLVALLLLNSVAAVFLLGSKKFYQPLEKIMACFVGFMLLAFLINFAFSRPAPAALAAGLIPRKDQILGQENDWLTIIAWIATTFSVAIAYFQAYLVRQKGWGEKDLQSGMIDVGVSAFLLGIITLMITGTAAAALRGNDLKDVTMIATQLEPAFGVWGKRLFCLGLFSAAYSSFLVNSTIGGFMLADGLGLGSTTSDPWPRRFAVVVLTIGLVVAIVMKLLGGSIVPAIVFAQALTVVVAPLLGLILIVLTNNKELMGKHTNGVALNTLAGLGLVMLFILSGYVVSQKIVPKIQSWIFPPANTASIEPEAARR
jgi:manganese transport protein